MTDRQIQINLQNLGSYSIVNDHDIGDGKIYKSINFGGPGYVGEQQDMDNTFFYGNDNGKFFSIYNVYYKGHYYDSIKHTIAINLEGSEIDMRCNNESCNFFSDNNVTIDISSLL